MGVRRVRAAASGSLVASLLLLATACGGESPASPADPSSTSSPTSTPTTKPTTKPSKSSSESPTVADPEHAVDPPGPRKGALVYADLMIKAQDALDPDVVKRINGAQGGPAVPGALARQRRHREPRSSTSARSTRRRTATSPSRASAELQEQWDRVAGGEVALEKKLAKQLQDKAGYVKLGNDEDAPDGAHRRLCAAGAADRRGREREVGRGARHPHRQRDADQHRRRFAARRDGRPAEDRRRRRGGHDPRAQPRPGRQADRGAVRWLGRVGGRDVRLHGARWRPDRAGASRGWRRTSAPSRCRSWATSPATR